MEAELDAWQYAWAIANMGDEKVMAVKGALPRVDNDDLLTYLTLAGSEGWELFAFLPGDAAATRLMFKRRMVEDEEPQAQTPDF
jgi:hypothetical protein